MKQLIIVLFMLCLNTAFAQRQIDISTELNWPIQGQTVQSPQGNFILQFKVHNLGPDTINNYDYFQLRSYFGGEIFYSPLYYFKNRINPGEFDSMSHVIGFTGNITIDSVACCIKISKFGTNSGDSIIPETSQQLKNNESCVYVNHIAAPTGIKDFTLSKKQFEIYPNPTSDRLQIKSENDKPITKVKMVNSLGILVYEALDLNQPIDLSTFKNGLYFVVIESEGQRETHTLFKTDY